MRKACEPLDNLSGGQAFAEPSQVLELVDTCPEQLVETPSSSSSWIVHAGLTEDDLLAVQLASPAQLKHILLLALPASLPVKRLLAADCLSRAVPSFDTPHRVSTEITKPRRFARLGFAPHPHNSQDRLRGILRFDPPGS
ncbi:unnamed protein product [Prorocentrum cordatum]|uniref:Uncharacterized protein n=1 Tax=Prorocentrum cordatum TaxID=2364126 RepID=A0ABN9SQN4_9DINO|nr:unnamed protein product [Polarella glacialis]